MASLGSDVVSISQKVVKLLNQSVSISPIDIGRGGRVYTWPQLYSSNPHWYIKSQGEIGLGQGFFSILLYCSSSKRCHFYGRTVYRWLKWEMAKAVNKSEQDYRILLPYPSNLFDITRVGFPGLQVTFSWFLLGDKVGNECSMRGSSYSVDVFDLFIFFFLGIPHHKWRAHSLLDLHFPGLGWPELWSTQVQDSLLVGLLPCSVCLIFGVHCESHSQN